MMASFDKALDVARERMGFAELFPKQREAVEAFVSGRDVFISLPTGYGKSFCYGCLPCLRDKKVTSVVVVVTPLVAIMKEQAIDFERKGLSAMYITCGSVGEGKMQDVLDGLYDLVFISPEQLLTKWCWREVLHSELYLNMMAFVVDEAHCVKKW